MELEKEYKEKMTAQLKEWNDQVNLLESRIDNFTADMKILRAEEIQALRAKHLAAVEKMNELGRLRGDAWEQVKVTADKMWDKMWDDLKSGLSDGQSKAR